MRTEKLALDRIRLATIELATIELATIELATIEAKEGRSARRHVADAVTTGRAALDAPDAGAASRVDLPAFDGAMAAFGEAVKAMDDHAAAHRDAFGASGSLPDGLLSHLREAQGRLKRAKGDPCRAAGLDMTFVQSDWKTTVTTSQLPVPDRKTGGRQGG